MLRRDRLIRMQIHELLDACLFALSFWLAYAVRTDKAVIFLFDLQPVEASSFGNYIWLYVILLPVAPMILEAQGFYNRPVLCSRRTTAWLLFKGCALTTLTLILALFLGSFVARFVQERNAERKRLAVIAARRTAAGRTGAVDAPSPWP